MRGVTVQLQMPPLLPVFSLSAEERVDKEVNKYLYSMDIIFILYFYPFFFVYLIFFILQS